MSAPHTRLPASTTKVETPFGNAYIHVHYDAAGNLRGAAISHPWKNPDAQVDKLIRALSDGLNAALRSVEGGR